MAEERRNPRHNRRRPRDEQSREDDQNIRKLVEETEEKLRDSMQPEALNGLNSFERKMVHRHFDHNPDFETRTYRDGGNYKLVVYPVGNITSFAEEKAQEALDQGKEIPLPPMGSYERFLVHNALKDFTGVETSSEGEGPERHVKIISKKFGRGLKKIAKKIKLM